MAAEAIVSVADLHKFFKRGSEKIDVLSGLTLDVPEGEFLALMGPSGSGKTTLLNLVAGLDQPSEGKIRVGDKIISNMSEGQLAAWRTRHVGFVFQFYHLLSVLSAYENVELPLLLLPLTSAQRKQQVLTALDLVGLTDRMHHRPGQLSGGQQQRVGIARAVVTDPTLIVADEPSRFALRGGHPQPARRTAKRSAQDYHHGDARSAGGVAGAARLAPRQGTAGR
jgi:putative ABC transport system ATP-binding protein